MLLASCNNTDDANLPKPTVYIQKTDDGYNLIRNGKPFYIQGAAAHPSYLEELKEAGANAARIYDTINLKETLDKAQDLGLAIAVDIPLPEFKNFPEYFEKEENFRAMKQNVERIVMKHKDHPALLYWNLGNELFYPYFFKNTSFFENFNTLIDLIHDLDPNHPVSTVTIGVNRVRILSIHRKSPQLDFISSNSFGSISEFSKRIKPLSPIWDGPHVISEWGNKGAWESDFTSWKAPIEETSTKKAQHIQQRYRDYIEPLKKNYSLGNFIFFWGQKNEHTPTWFSLFNEDGKKTQAVFELMKIWKKDLNAIYEGPELDYILMNRKGALSNIILTSGSRAELEIILPEKEQKNLEYHWEVRHESWYDVHESILVDTMDFKIEGEKAFFNAPVKEGPYRVFLNISNGSDYIATANIPFYVLSTGDGE
ncbi:MAG TPA: glycoside hydrolase family 2 TIM barrel-domain containing protein [Gillisia sp.]|nr:glycoside hydrolase family 2 TIM barrel-domain containing protein [Gillisia sp.]